MKRFISFSGGVESTTMCVLFGNKADAIFADTGFEHQQLYDRLDMVESKVREIHGNDFKIIKVKREGESLPEYIKSSKFYPSYGSRYCTRMFKIEPIDDYLKQFESKGAEILIGLNSDEADDRTGNYMDLKWVTYSYPLVEAGINRDMCKSILNHVGLLPNFPAYMKRGGCVGCYMKSKKEFQAMAVLNPTEYDLVSGLEQEIQDKRDKFFHIIDSIANLKDFKRHAESILFNPEEIYPVINNATKCGVFCHR